MDLFLGLPEVPVSLFIYYEWPTVTPPLMCCQNAQTFMGNSNAVWEKITPTTSQTVIICTACNMSPP